MYVWTFLNWFIVNYRESQYVDVFYKWGMALPSERTKCWNLWGRIKEILKNNVGQPTATGDIKTLTSLQDNLISHFFIALRIQRLF